MNGEYTCPYRCPQCHKNFKWDQPGLTPDCNGAPGTECSTQADDIEALRFARQIVAAHNDKLAHVNARLDQLEKAEAELKRLGYGVEPIYVFGSTGLPLFTSHVGDLAHDTAQNRERTRMFIDRAERAFNLLEDVERQIGTGACAETPELHGLLDALAILRGMK
jgi:hypothetical protein